MTKSELRKKYKTLRSRLSETEIDDLSIQIANNILKLDIWNYSFYHTFLTIEEQNEVNTEYLLSILSGKDKNTLVSKSDFNNGDMVHYLLTDSTPLKKNSYNIPEPIDGIEISNDNIDVVFIPLLAFDKKGNRIGYGKGFYDRFLSNCNPKTIKVGLSFFESEDILTEIFEHDIKLDYCITPKKNYKFI